MGPRGAPRRARVGLPLLAAALLAVTPGGVGSEPVALHCGPHEGSPGATNELPVVRIASPAEGARVAGVLTISGSAFDAEGQLCRLSLRIDGGPWFPLVAEGAWSAVFDTRDLANGAHRIEAQASDPHGDSLVDARSVAFENEPWTDLAVHSSGLELRGSGVVEVRATLRNVGTAPSGAFDVSFFHGKGEPVRIGTARAGPVAPGERTTASVPWITVGIAGRHHVSVAVDVAGEVAEARETNNRAGRDFVLLTEAPPIDALGPVRRR